MLAMAGHPLQTPDVLLFIVLLLWFCYSFVVKEGPGTTRVTQWTCVCCA